MTRPVLLRVNGRDVSVEHAVRHALFDPQGRRFLETLVDQELLRQHASSTGLTISADELQNAANEMRYERGLQQRERALEWMRAHGQTLESIEDEIELLLLRRKVADAIPESEIEEYYRAHRDALEYVVLFSIRADSEAEAAALRARLDAGEPFPAVASAGSRDTTTRRAGGFVGRTTPHREGIRSVPGRRPAGSDAGGRGGRHSPDAVRIADGASARRSHRAFPSDRCRVASSRNLTSRFLRANPFCAHQTDLAVAIHLTCRPFRRAST